MAVVIWRGDSQAVAQITRVTLSGSVNQSSDVGFTIGNKTLIVESPGETRSGLLQAAEDAWNDSEVAEFAEITATYGVDESGEPYLDLEADEPGKPFTVTVSGLYPVIDVDPIQEATPGTNEVQSFYFTSTRTGGTYTITQNFGSGDETSDAIAWNGNLTAIKAKMVSGMASVTEDNVTITGAGTMANPYVITYSGSLGNRNLAELTVNTGSLTAAAEVEISVVQNIGDNAPTVWMMSYRKQDAYGGSGGSSQITVTVDGVSSTIDTMQFMTLAFWQSKFTKTISNFKTQTLSDNTGSEIGCVVFSVFEDNTISCQIDYGSSGTLLTHVAAEKIQQHGNSSGANEHQFVHGYDDGASASRTYTFEGQTTTSISSTGSLKSVLEALSNIGSGDITVHVPASAGTLADPMVIVEFGNAMANSNEGLITVSVGTAPSALANGGGLLNEIHRIIVRGDGGTFTLDAGGTPTGNLSYAIAAAALETAIDGLSEIGSGNSSVTGSGTDASPFYVEYVSGKAGTNVPTLVSDVTNLTLAVGSEVTTVTAGDPGTPKAWSVELIGATGGTWSVKVLGKTASGLAYNASSATVQTAVQALSSVGSGNMTVTGSDGGPYTFTAAGSLSGQDLADPVAENKLLTGTASPTATVTETTASTGPEHVDEPLNYSTGSLPSNSDTLVLTNSNRSMRYGLDALASVTLAELIIHSSYTGEIGLPVYDADGEYFQYRGRSFEVGATVVSIGEGDGPGSSLMRLDLKAVQSTINVFNTGSPANDGEKALVLFGTHASNVLNVTKGSVEVAPTEGSSSTLATVRTGFLEDQESDVDLRMNAGVTLTNLYLSGGQVEIHSDTTVLEAHNTNVLLIEGGHADIDLFNSVLDWRTTDEVTNLTAKDSVVDCSKDPRQKDFNSGNVIELFGSSTELRDPLGTLPSGVDIRKNLGTETIITAGGKLIQVT
ncbi:hypothetical protein KOR42_22580 [Thalassoglobus neptunius]|uniref:Uncharacterized protein n=1 Tax=Thalassoglobus neptunius TaxID=1938619 RepID=A0A5C5X920_9PLAN|nr:hypothetical protein [Thalassoglobus neptunius]TWT58871.1 hypothetical protein KOR42_22580 [Thalassoglobus neptunius]